MIRFKLIYRLEMAACLTALLLLAGSAWAQSSTLEQVRSRGQLICGVNGNLPGFSSVNAAGSYSGFDVDFCRALAAAVLGDADAVSYRSLTAQERLPALLDGSVDVLIRNTTWTSSRDAQMQLEFAPTTFYDGQGVMVRADSGIDSLEDLAGHSVCVQQGTTTELNLADQFRRLGVPYSAIIFVTNDISVRAFEQGICDAFTTDKSGIASLRSQLADPSQYKILDETLSKEPLGPSVREGDAQWHEIVQWVVFGLMQAEEYGISSSNVAQVAQTTDRPAIRRFLGVEGALWEDFGLDAAVMQRVIAQVGNYEEIYNRHLGPGTATEIPRGLNRLWNEGGLLYAPPFSPN